MSAACEEADAATSIAAVKQAEMALQRFWRARLRIGVIGASRCFFLAGYPAWEGSQSRWGLGVNGLTPSLRTNGSRVCAADDRLREAIHPSARGCMDCFVAIAPRNEGGTRCTVCFRAV